jgi:hypothetical protein
MKKDFIEKCKVATVHALSNMSCTHVHVEKKYKPQVFCLLTSNPTNIKIYRRTEFNYQYWHVQKHRLRVHVHTCYGHHTYIHVHVSSSRKTCI